MTVTAASISQAEHDLDMWRVWNQYKILQKQYISDEIEIQMLQCNIKEHYRFSGDSTLSWIACMT